ncbi:Glycosyl transferases group 1 [Sporobacter termitidis DSM 10068]|uniref:Glycosyl transferases group 1 n=1 Tax=Sporobacter termitidis DSM 10068 TaxID=1123282 RepID=A0A1M5UAS6_9FIRM|nr:glycosyltransferase [Sporobacter termitidis]SHH59956.1 Glycosyl transferases group 1 [Sporobacter termitidis DSM 10068]
MKVLIYGHKIFANDMLWGFLQTGCDARVLNTATVEQFDKTLESMNPDLLITLGPPLELNHSVMQFIGNRNASAMKYVHWDTDGISSQFYKSASGEGIEMDVIHLSRPDLVLTMCPDMLDCLKSQNIASDRMNYAYSPMSHHPISGADAYHHLFSIIGQSYLRFAQQNPEHYRYRSIKILLQPLIENNYKIAFFGDDDYRTLLKTLYQLDVPKHWFKGYLPYEQTCGIYNSTYINLVTQNHEHTLTKRTFEILGSGGFLISSENDEIKRLFTPGKDLEVSSSPEQTLELVQYYRNHPEAHAEIRRNAIITAQDHTYKQRAEFILKKLSLPS